MVKQIFFYILKLFYGLICYSSPIIAVYFLCKVYRAHPEAFITSVGSCISAVLAVVLGYYYSCEKNEFYNYYKTFRQYIWKLSENKMILEMILARPDLDIQTAVAQLEEFEPFMLDRFPLIDDGLRNQFLQCQFLIIKIKINPSYATNPKNISIIQSAISNTKGEIKFLELVDEYFLIWFVVPKVLKYIKKKFYSDIDF